MKSFSILSIGALVLAQAVSVFALDGLVIDVTKAIPDSECTVKSKKGDKISVHYEGRLEDGSVFDSSYKRGSPIIFTVGTGQVITGWDKGLEDMCIGEKRELTISPDLAYGDRGIGPIPPKATLYFSTELVDIAGSGSADHDEL